ETRGRQVEGTRLARMIPRMRGQDSEQLFLQYFEAFLNLKEFKSTFAPFKEEEVTETWLTFLNPTLISCRYGTTAAEFGLVGYFPNLVSR
ncbi:hypothetical protein A2U01_0062643, partial [Trifolium medium]|nr:hypothetical protein [Trifolium medium]